MVKFNFILILQYIDQVVSKKDCRGRVVQIFYKLYNQQDQAEVTIYSLSSMQRMDKRSYIGGKRRKGRKKLSLASKRMLLRGSLTHLVRLIVWEHPAWINREPENSEKKREPGKQRTSKVKDLFNAEAQINLSKVIKVPRSWLIMLILEVYFSLHKLSLHKQTVFTISNT